MSLNDREQSVIDAVRTGLFLQGEWRDAEGGGTFDVEDPSTGSDPHPGG